MSDVSQPVENNVGDESYRDPDFKNYDFDSMFERGQAEYSSKDDRYDEINASVVGTRPEPDLSGVVERLSAGQRVFIFGGTASDKRAIARYCAYNFSRLNNDSQLGGPQIRAAEVRRQLFDNPALEQEDWPTVFVLSNVSPAQFHRLSNSVRAATRGNDAKHWVVISTDQPRDTWQLPAELESQWIDLDDSALYSVEDLATYLFELLDPPSRGTLLRLGRGRWADIKGAVADLAGDLRHPEAVEAFVAELRRAGAQETVLDIDALVATALDQRQTVGNWFTHELTPVEQISAIAFAFFHNLEENVAFAAMDFLMQGAWKERDAGRSFVDYGDLVNFRRYVSLNSDESVGSVIFCRSEEARRAILTAGWRSHRRRIIAALPDLVRLALASARQDGVNRNILTSPADRVRLRETIGETLGELWMLSADALELPLLDLIASGKDFAHAVVATALRRVRRERGLDGPLAMLGGWRSRSELLALLQRLSGSATRDKMPELMGTAIVSILARLALEEPTDRMDPRLEKLVLDYASARQKTVLQRFCQVAVPTLVQRHTGQMIGLIDRFFEEFGGKRAVNEMFCEGFGVGLGWAITHYRPNLIEQVRTWIQAAAAGSGKGFDPALVGRREQLAAVGCHALGWLRTGDRQTRAVDELDNMTRSAMELLTGVLKVERHPFVREAAIQSVNRLARFGYASVQGELKNTILAMTTKESEVFVDFMVDLHCRQRSQQPDGDTFIKIGESEPGYWCPIWYSKEPENTPVSDTLFRWANDKSNPEVSKFASVAVLQLRRVIERSQESSRTKLLEERRQHQAELARIAERVAPELDRQRTRLTFIQRLAVSLAVLGQPDLKTAVTGILGAVLPLPEHEAREVIARYRREGEQQGSHTADGKQLLDTAVAAGKAYRLSQTLGFYITLAVFGVAAAIGYLTWR